MIRKVLIANRGEIALRILRACRDLGLRTVAVHSTVDTEALHVRFADEAVCIGPPAPRLSYLHIPALIAAAEITGADAIHPGYGFLSESAEFAEVCRRCRLTFIGPSPESMRQWGDKVRAREMARRFGLPLLPGSGVLRDAAEAVEAARTVGFPVMLKAAGGGGGRGMKVVRDAAALSRRRFMRRSRRPSRDLATATSSSSASSRPRGTWSFRWWPTSTATRCASASATAPCSGGTRSSSRSRPRPALRPEHARGGERAHRARHARERGTHSLGTLEFLLDERGELYFMEMNTRVQVEHPVTEMVTGLDLVAEQILIARGARLAIPLRTLTPRGHALECRINAEDAVTFAPSPGAHHGVSPAGRRGRARRLRGVRRLDRAAALRLAPGEGDRARAHARRGPSRACSGPSTSLSSGASPPTCRCTVACWTHPTSSRRTFSTRFHRHLWAPSTGPVAKLDARPAPGALPCGVRDASMRDRTATPQDVVPCEHRPPEGRRGRAEATRPRVSWTRPSWSTSACSAKTPTTCACC
jgi:acetyl-CoA carboxylase biotin carboxylase subunit